MKLVQLTPGAGSMYCGNCVRDNALVHGLRKIGHDVTMVPLYLPLTLDESDESAGTPLFYGGINVYLEQQAPVFGRAPSWLHSLLSNTRLLKWAGKRAGSVDPAHLGKMTFSMFQGEHGRQRRELDELTSWLASQPRPDVVCLSNALLLGMAEPLRRRLGVPVVCQLQGEDTFLDELAEPYKSRCWEIASQCARAADMFIAPSQFFGRKMTDRLGLNPSRVKVLWNGINLDGYEAQPAPDGAEPVIGFLARLCPQKGLDKLVDAFIAVRQRGKIHPRLCAVGYCGESEHRFVDTLKDKLARAGLAEAAEFVQNPTREEKIRRLRSFTVFSVPGRIEEAFGLYIVEALAAGIPVVQPAKGAFTELVNASGGGILYTEDTPKALSHELERLLLDSPRRQAFSAAGRKAAREYFTAEKMAADTTELYSKLMEPAAASIRRARSQ